MIPVATLEKLRSAGWFFTPFAVVGVIALTTGSSQPAPEQTQVSEEFAPRDAVPFASITKRVTPGEEETAAMNAEIARLGSIEHLVSPFASNEQYEQEEPVGVQRSPSEATHEFHLTSVMSGAGGDVCVINKRVRRVGDFVAAGWVIREIDTANRSVILEGPKGKQLVLSQR